MRLFVAAAVLLLAPSLAVAEDLAAGPQGWVGTMRRLASAPAPLPPADELALDPAHDGAVVVSTEPRISLAEWLPDGHRVIYLGLSLRTETPTTLHAFLGVTGEVTAFLDGVALGSFERGRDREDDWHVPLALGPGSHRFVLRVRLPEPRAGLPRRRPTLRMRFLDGDFTPGLGHVRASVGEVPDADALARAALRVDEGPALRDGAPALHVRVHAPAGGVDRPVHVAWDGEETRLSPGGGELSRWLPVPERGPLQSALSLRGEPTPLGRRVALDRPLLRAMAQLAPRLPSLGPSARGPMQWRLEEMARVLREEDGDRRWRRWLVRDTRAKLRALDRGRDPFARLRGYERMAHISAIDGSAQPYELFVPPSYRGRRAWPLLITLHGFKGNAGDYFRNTFGLARDWQHGETLRDHGRHGVAPTEGPMIVVAPEGRGQAMYRHMGETDVLEALADVRRRLRVDPRRIYITGGSMGGTGAAYLPLRHPDLFAAAAALAGYHDQRVREDTHHEGLSEVERFLQARRSDVDWAENALHIPMLLVRGTRDRPLAWTRSLATRLRELGYDVELREPALGHNVWTETYAEGAIFEWMRRHRRPAAPRHVRLRTARERTARSYWVRIDGRRRADAFAEVDARLRAGAVEATTSEVEGLTFLDVPGVEGPLTVHVDGQTFTAPLPLSLRRQGDAWELGRLDPTGRKRARVSGPIRDPFHDRVVFVVGTQDPRHTFINRRVAEDWARPAGVDVRYPIVDDVDVTAEMIAGAHLVLIGPPWSNALHARWHAQLPIRYDELQRAVRARRMHRGAEVGAAFVAPNPDNPERSVLVLAGTTPLGTWRARFLPDLLPDWVVFDEGVANARGQWSCGGARRDDGSPNGAEPAPCRYRAHGLFDMRWGL